MDASFHYTTKRSDFGRYPPFDDHSTRIFLSIEPEQEVKDKFAPLNTYNIGIQTKTTYSQHSVNTEVTQTKLQETFHQEGSWPAGIDPTNAPSCKQTRLKAEKKENFAPQIRTLSQTTEKAARVNVALDLFSDHFHINETPLTVHDPCLRTLAILRDKYNDRYISSLSWSSDTGSTRRVAICYTPTGASGPTTHLESFVYNLECISVPEIELHPSSPLLCLEYNQKDNNFIVGGMSHGSLSLWDVRQGPLPVWTSAIESSHRDGVYAIRWISAKTAFECVSVSGDGTTMTWDTRNTTAPTEVINLDVNQEALALAAPGVTLPFSGRLLDYHPAVPTKYMVGTVDGVAMVVNRKAADPSQRISGIYGGHSGPIYCVKRHPSDTKYFCTIADWGARIWSEDNKAPIMYLPAQRHYLTGAVWGVGRTSVLYTTNNIGTIDAWDFIQSLRQPVCSISVGLNPIRNIAIDNSGKYIITGDSIGTSTLLELNEPLQNISQQEKLQFSGMLSREAKRVKNYDQFMKEQKARQKGKELAQAAEGEAAAPVEWDPSEIDQQFENALQGIIDQGKEKQRVRIGDEGEEEAPKTGLNIASTMAEAAKPATEQAPAQTQDQTPETNPEEEQGYGEEEQGEGGEHQEEEEGPNALLILLAEDEDEVEEPPVEQPKVVNPEEEQGHGEEEQPGEGRERPHGEEEQPGEGGEQSHGEEEQPGEGGERPPAEGGEQPAQGLGIAGLMQSVGGGDQPAEGGEQTTEGGEHPAEGEEQQTEGGEHPAEGEEQQTEGGEQPAETGETEQPAETGETEQPAVTGETEQPAVTGETEQPAETVETEQPAETEQPTETVETEQPAETAETEQPAEAVETEQPAEVVETEQPAEAVETEQPAEAAETEQPPQGLGIAGLMQSVGGGETPAPESEPPANENEPPVVEAEQPAEVAEQPAEGGEAEQPAEGGEALGIAGNVQDAAGDPPAE